MLLLFFRLLCFRTIRCKYCLNLNPTLSPIFVPTAQPVFPPSPRPTAKPSPAPTHDPTERPTPRPTLRPTLLPTVSPTLATPQNCTMPRTTVRANLFAGTSSLNWRENMYTGWGDVKYNVYACPDNTGQGCDETKNLTEVLLLVFNSLKGNICPPLIQSARLCLNLSMSKMMRPFT